MLMALMYSLNSFASEENRIITPEDLIKVFYENLLSDKEPSESPDIFYNINNFVSIIPDSYKENLGRSSTDSTIMWKYLKKNKDLFLFPTIDPTETVEKATVSYLFTNFPERAVFFEGRFSVILTAPLSKKGKDGIIKEVIFSLERNQNPYQYRYLLNLYSSSVNGIYLEPCYNEFRSGELFKKLGFPTLSGDDKE